MNEMKQADIYMAYLDKILAGEKDIGPVADGEVENLLQLAKTLIATDFSVSSQIKADLRERLQALVRKEDKSSLAVVPSEDDELDDAALSNVAAAGLFGQTVCPVCGSNFILPGGICGFCRKG